MRLWWRPAPSPTWPSPQTPRTCTPSAPTRPSSISPARGLFRKLIFTVSFSPPFVCRTMGKLWSRAQLQAPSNCSPILWGEIIPYPRDITNIKTIECLLFISSLLCVVKGKLHKLEQFTIQQEKSFVSSQFSFRPAPPVRHGAGVGP